MPYFGICLGMQIAVIEFARHVAGIADADSGEFNEMCNHKVIDFMPGQSDEIDKGGTLRLGGVSLRHSARHHHGALLRHAGRFHERHRHRYEFNNDYRRRADRRRADALSGTVSGRAAGGNRGTDGSALLCGRPVSSGVQVPPQSCPIRCSEGSFRHHLSIEMRRGM